MYTADQLGNSHAVKTCCCLCLRRLQHVFNTIVLNKYTGKAFYCENCGFLQIDNPTWLDEAYSEAIAVTDTGLVMRNLALSQQLTPLLYHVFGADKHFVDLAGGTGLLVRLMRDAGLDFYWNDAYCRNIHARGFEFSSEIGPCAAVTAFEVLEHLTNPIDFLKKAINQTQADFLIFSTELFEGSPPQPENWWYYTFETGQHIAFYQNKTLQFVANELGFIYSKFGQMHIFYKKQHSGLLNLYFSSNWVREKACFMANNHLLSKTMPDHMMLSAAIKQKTP